MELNDSHQNQSNKYLTFIVSNERYAIEIIKIQEIIKITPITKVPKSEPYIKGVINLRGKIIPVIDLRLRFGIPPINYDDRTCIVIVNVALNNQKLTLGLIVDTVLEVMSFSTQDIQPTPNYGEHFKSDFVTGIVQKDQHHNILIDINRIVGDQPNMDKIVSY